MPASCHPAVHRATGKGGAGRAGKGLLSVHVKQAPHQNIHIIVVLQPKRDVAASHLHQPCKTHAARAAATQNAAKEAPTRRTLAAAGAGCQQIAFKVKNGKIHASIVTYRSMPRTKGLVRMPAHFKKPCCCGTCSEKPLGRHHTRIESSGRL